YPLPHSLFYWSSDPKGMHPIAAEVWEQYGIPELRVETWVGSFWYELGYDCTCQYLELKGYNLDGQEYARDHNYPKLIQGDPHDIRIVECEQPAGDQHLNGSHLTSPLVESPSKNNNEHELDVQVSQVVHAQPGFMRQLFNGFWSNNVPEHEAAEWDEMEVDRVMPGHYEVPLTALNGWQTTAELTSTGVAVLPQKRKRRDTSTATQPPVESKRSTQKVLTLTEMSIAESSAGNGFRQTNRVPEVRVPVYDVEKPPTKKPCTRRPKE
ncbi:hypothetical protein V5O48_010321, partial [Marasmius crinis-equi]